MLCPSCQRENRPAAEFCAYCQARLTTPAPDPAAGSGNVGAWAAVPPVASSAAEFPAAVGGVSLGLAPSAPQAPSAVSAIAPAPVEALGRFAPPTTPLTGAMIPRPGRAPRPTPRQDAVFGSDGFPAPDYAETATQLALRRMYGSDIAIGKWSAAMLGAVLAALIGLLCNALTMALWSKAADLFSGVTTSSVTSPTATGLIQTSTAIAQSVLASDVLKMLTFEQGVPLSINHGTVSVNVPLTGFTVIPVIALIVGGYLAGASDYQRRPRFSIARGALIGPFYAVFLGICAFLSSSSLLENGAASGAGVVSPSLPMALLLGLVWGAVFGAFGGWLQLATQSGLSAILPTLQVASRRSRVAARVRALLAGAIVSVCSGVLFSLAVCLAGYAFAMSYWTATASSMPLGDGATPLVTLGREALLALVAGPLAAAWLFAVSTGGWFTVFGHAIFPQGLAQRTIVGLIGAPHIPPSPLWYGLLALPVVSFTLGGRMAARAWPTRTVSAGLLAGLLTAIPTALLMAALAYLTELQFHAYASSGSHTALQTLVIGPDVARTAIATLIGAAVFGALGGASAETAPALGSVARLITLPVRPVAGVLSPLINRLLGRRVKGRPSLSDRWFYDALALTIVDACIAIIVAVIAAVIPAPLPYVIWAQINGALAAALIAAPVFCFACAFISAVMAPPDWAQPVGVAPSAAGITGRPVVAQVASVPTP